MSKWALIALLISGPLSFATEPAPAQPGSLGSALASILQGEQIEVPCEANVNFGENQCKIGLRGCDSVKGDLIKQISTIENPGYSQKIKAVPVPDPSKLGFVDIKIWGYYHGKDLSMAGSATSALDGTPYPLPVCNVVDGEMGMVCGQTVKAKLEGSKPVGEVNATRGTQESAYLRGAWIQALKCYKAQVISEIRAGKLKIHPKNRALAQDVAALYDTSRRVSQKLVNEVYTGNQSDPEDRKNFCTQDDQLEHYKEAGKVADLCKAEGKTMDKQIVEHRMSSCYLRAARQQAETAFANLAAAEVFARADTHYALVFDNGGEHSMFNMFKRFTLVTSSMSDTVGCKKHLYKVPPDIDKAKDCSVDKFQKSYDRGLGSNMAQFVALQFPNSGACMNPSALLGAR